MDREGQERSQPRELINGRTPSETIIPELDEDALVTSPPLEPSKYEWSGQDTAMPRKALLAEEVSEIYENDPVPSTALQRYFSPEDERRDLEPAAETTPLLAGWSTKASMHRLKSSMSDFKRSAGKVTARDIFRSCVSEPVKTLPSVILGTLLNVLDGVSYGMILCVSH